jgi:hypothetical protein
VIESEDYSDLSRILFERLDSDRDGLITQNDFTAIHTDDSLVLSEPMKELRRGSVEGAASKSTSPPGHQLNNQQQFLV